MKSKNLFGFAILGIAAILLNSCGQSPQKEIEAANAALDSAKTAGAELYAPENFLALKDSLQAIMEGIEGEKSSLFKDFSTSVTQLNYVVQQSGEVVKQAESRKLELKAQIQSATIGVKDLIETNRQLILEAPKGKEGASALLAIGQELSSIEMVVSQSDSLMLIGELIPSLDKVNVAREKASSINTELNTVVDKYKLNAKAKRG